MSRDDRLQQHLDKLEQMKDKASTGESSGSSLVVIDVGAYRDFFPELKVGIKDDKTGKFFETKAGDVYETVISEFHDMFTRRTFQEMAAAGSLGGDQVMSAFEFGANFDRRGIRDRNLDELEFIFEYPYESEGTKEERDTTINYLIDQDMRHRAQRRREDAKKEEALQKRIAENMEKLKESRRNNPNWAAVMERMQPGVYYGEFGSSAGGAVSMGRHAAMQDGKVYGLAA